MPTTDEFFESFAACFVGSEHADDGTDIAWPELIDRTKLDFSLDSLHEVDRYLVELHERRDELAGRVVFNTVLWGGAYLGEVIRRRAEIEFHWVDYEDYAERFPEIRELVGARAVMTYAFLVKPSGAMSVPIGKVHKCLVNGLEDSVHFHADCELAAQHR